MKSFYIETYGCQMNVAESNALEALLSETGWMRADRPEDADAVIINTCSVRKSAENRIWGRLGDYKHIKEQKKQTLIVTGCMAQRLLGSMKKDAPQIDYVVPVNDKLKIPELLRTEENRQRKTETVPCSPVYEFTENYLHEGDYSSYVPIMNGCNNFCTYCIVPYVRGREVSRCPEQILEEVGFLDFKGVKEITLLGQNVNSYDFNGMRFPDLLKEICFRCNNIRWVRFESPHPKDFSEELIDVIANEPKVAKHLHIPMQSGSTRILQAMNRHYTREQYLNLIDRIREHVPGVTFAVDVMVGFPGETEDDFAMTVSAMDYCGYIEAYMYYWNMREGTKACTMPGQIPVKERQARLQMLIDWQLKKCSQIKAGRTGTVQDVLVTGISRDSEHQMLGKNEHGEMIVFDTLSDEVSAGDFVRVRFESLNGNTFTGKQVNE
ncbi:MAG: tRNA (N6-isopentenyl adenosine(37)-C2)-methylthiotransferase MiaB [Sphaerochaetaceae bacterium]|nr:tRNA (N6-isopentenyl adenosine(37)-C2)-methylthiotransferase MiaB [Sphaerochaetaceae bacterium]